MNNWGRKRRRFLILIGQLGVSLGLLRMNIAAGQNVIGATADTDTSSQAGNSSTKEIAPEEYQEWLNSMREAAKNFAKKRDGEYNEKALDKANSEFDKNARAVLKENGYSVPSPPTNIQIQQIY